ncbi:Squamosa promoter-binding-like protein [Drosera capensis]
MEQVHRFYGVGSSGLELMGKRRSEWDLNEWKWDGDLFVASKLNPVTMPSNLGCHEFVPVSVNGNSSNSSSTCSDDVRIEIGNGDLDRKRRVVVIDEDSVDDEAGNLSLKLCGGYAGDEKEVGNMEGNNRGKKTKLGGGSSSRCQVEDCRADLTHAKDYHRRHKVCEIHSKASKALVGNVMQRFCQQCSRFHVLQEFDEGKRSCRRRLAGHNKRRRKTQPEPAVSVQPVNDEQVGGLVLVSLLKLLSGMQANNSSAQTTDQELVSHLLRSLAGQSVSLATTKGVHESQKLLVDGKPTGNSELTSASVSRCLPPRPTDQHHTSPSSVLCTKPSIACIKDSPPADSELRDGSLGSRKVNNFDLNDVYVDSDDGVEDLERSRVAGSAGSSGTASLDCPSWTRQDSQQSSPPHVSGNSDSASAQSPSSSSGEAQSRTDRIVFKLFGKEPNQFPIFVRKQILDWLAHSPTEIESYIRPGCVVLTIYLRLSDSIWEELCSDLSSSLARLFNISNDAFWATGWLYTRVQHRIAFSFDGQVVADAPIPDGCNIFSRIVSVKPIAVAISEQAQFQIRGTNLYRPTTRVLCALEGQYLHQEFSQETVQEVDDPQDIEEIESFTFSCRVPSALGRGFIEVSLFSV